ncbi:hypothetical protein HYS85_00960 [Candidatus Saccharibacteria bacterium]|nr:hypothetical protein [Candidatus Saccharibacteria bacterium]
MTKKAGWLAPQQNLSEVVGNPAHFHLFSQSDYRLLKIRKISGTGRITKHRVFGVGLSILSPLAYPIYALPVLAAPSDPSGPSGTGGSSGGSDLSNNPIIKDIQLVIDFLSVGVGIVVVGVIILGGIQYAMAGDSPEAVGKAKQRIMNGLIALLAFIFTYSFVQWLVPGGVF